MSFTTSLIKSKTKSLRDSGIKLLATWDPEAVGEAQLQEWNDQAKRMADIAVKAATDADTARTSVTTIQENVTRYTLAAEKLAATNEAAAEKAADAALEWKGKLDAAIAEAKEAAEWADETRDAAEKAQKLVLEGKDRIAKAKRTLEQARQHADVAANRRSEREKMAGLDSGLGGTDAAVNALEASANKFKQAAAADDLRSGVLGKAVENDDAVKAALAEVDGTNKPKSLAEKLAALKN